MNYLQTIFKLMSSKSFSNVKSVNRMKQSEMLPSCSVESLDQLDLSHYQAEIPWNQLLPYFDKLDNEADVLLASIKKNLGYCVMTRDIDPGAVHWSNVLAIYIRLYGLRFCKDEHIVFVKLIYELLTIPNLQPSLIKFFADVLYILLKKKELIMPNELEIPWENLFKMYKSSLNKKEEKMLYRDPDLTECSLYRLIEVAKIHFSPNATQEILDEMRPYLYPAGTQIHNDLKLLRLFLPIQMPVEQHKIGHELWFHEMMKFWKDSHHLLIIENEMLELMADLAFENIGYIDWNPYIAIMFTRFLQNLELPVDYKKIKRNNRRCNNSINEHAMAKWIAAVLGDNSNAQIYLEKFFKTVETYFHPANYGTWTYKLRNLVIFIAEHVSIRLKRERHKVEKLGNPTPDSHKLTDANVDALVTCMIPATTSAIFGDIFTSSMVAEMVQSLAYLRPNLVIPKILEKFDTLLNTDTDQQQIDTHCLNTIARPLVQGSHFHNKDYAFAKGPLHVMPLLFAALSRINPNEPMNSLSAIELIRTYVSLIPLVDCSNSPLERSEADQLICEQTSRFEDFVLELLNKTFGLIRSGSQISVRMDNQPDDRRDLLERLAELELRQVFSRLLQRASEALLGVGLERLRALVLAENLEVRVAGPMAAAVCESFGLASGRLAVRALVPCLAERVLDFLEEHGESVKEEERLDEQLLYPLLLLKSVAKSQGDALLPHIDLFVKVLDETLRLKCSEASEIACGLLENLLESLCSVRPINFDDHLNDPKQPHWEDWGRSYDIEALRLNWYVPGEQEFAAAHSIFTRYCFPAVSAVQSYSSNVNTFATRQLSRDELQTNLKIIKSVVKGCEYVLPIWKEFPVNSGKYQSCVAVIEPTVGINYEIKLSNGDNVKQFLVKIMTPFQTKLLENVEDDTKSLLLLVQIWRYLSGNSVNRSTNRMKNQALLYNFRKMVEYKEIDDKGRVPTVLLDYAAIQHEYRKIFYIRPVSKTGQDIILNLFKLSISKYGKVRAESQNVLSEIFVTWPHSCDILIPHIVDILNKDTEVHHDAFKGVLYLLMSNQGKTFLTNSNWQFLKNLLPALVLSKPTEKQSTIHLQNAIVNLMKMSYSTLNINLNVPANCVLVASELWKVGQQLSSLQPDQDTIERGAERLKKIGQENLQTYYGLLNDIIGAVLEKKLHWRHCHMATNFVAILLHPEHAPPVSVTRYFFNALIHDLIDERKLALQITSKILYQMKRKYVKISIDVPGLSTTPVPGMRPDNAWLQYNSDNLPSTAEQWDEPRYVHRKHVGFYVWPKRLEMYARSPRQPSFELDKRLMSEQELEVDRFFKDPVNVNQLVEFLRLDEKRELRGLSALLFKGLFRNYGDAYLGHLLPQLRELVRDTRDSAQRCAAELLSGIVRGARNWPYAQSEALWRELLPVLRLALDNITTETLNDWTASFQLIARHTDPSRVHWLIEALIDEALKPERGFDRSTSINEQSRLRLLSAILWENFWRVSELFNKLLPRLELYLLENPLKGVRDELTPMFSMVFSLNASCRRSYGRDSIGHPQVEDFIGRQQELISKLADDKLEVSRKFVHTLCLMLARWPGRNYADAMSAFDKFYPLIVQMENQTSLDPELSELCSKTLALYASKASLSENVPVVLRAINEASNSSFWSVRCGATQFLETWLFHNMYLLLSRDSWLTEVQTVVLRLLEDERLEVRENAAKVLTGMLHCTLVTDRQTLLEKFKKMSRKKLSEKIKKFGGSDLSNVIRLRHIGVLGMCTFIQAHPYDIPKDVPPIFECLSAHLSDPEPIPTTIRKTLNDFKRTHCDSSTGLQGLAEQLTPEQFELLQDLNIPPSYYN